MVAQWFYQTAEGRQSGPIDSKELRRLADAGIVRPDTLIRQSESASWVRAERARGLFQPSTPAPSSSPGTTPPVPPPVARRQIDKGDGGSRSEPSSSQAAAKATPIDAPGPDSSSESNNKPGYAMRYFFAIVACGFELVAYAAICDITGWNRMGFIGLIPLLIFLAIWRATWVAITKTGNNGSEAMPTKASSAAHEASTSYEVRSLELSKAVGEQGAEKTSAQTPFSTSGPSATRPLMWHAGRLFARCREVYTRHPGIFLISAGIMTAGILLLIAVMSGTYHTEQKDSPERIESIDTSPKSKGTAGEVEKFMKECMNQAVFQNNQYLAELDEIGWNRILDPEHLARDTSLAKSKVTIRKAKELVDKYTEQMNLLLAKARNDINALNLSAIEKTKAKQAFERGMQESSQTRNQIWQLERELVWKFGEIIDFLYRDYGNWSVSDGQLIFGTDDTVAAYNLYLGSIKNLVAQQEQLRRYGAQKVQAGLDRLRPDLGP